MDATITCRLVSLADAADALAVSRRTVRRYIADGQLEAVRLGHEPLRVKVDSIERFIDARPGGTWRGDRPWWRLKWTSGTFATHRLVPKTCSCHSSKHAEAASP